MKAFLDYILEMTNEEPFKITYIKEFNRNRIIIEHKGLFISGIWANHTIYNKNIKKKLIGYSKSFFANTIFYAPLMKWRFL